MQLSDLKIAVESADSLEKVFCTIKAEMQLDEAFFYADDAAITNIFLEFRQTKNRLPLLKVTNEKLQIRINSIVEKIRLNDLRAKRQLNLNN